MSATGLQKHYIPETKEVDIDRAVCDKFAATFYHSCTIIHTRVAPTHADVPKATEELFDIVQGAQQTVDNNKKIAHWKYTHELDQDTGSITLTLKLFYVCF